MRRSLIPTALLSVLFLTSLAGPPVLAQDFSDRPPPDQAQGPEDQDPPSRIARLSLTQGSVSLEPAGAQEWATADLNRPLTTGDKLWTDRGSRAELDIGAAAIRLGETTGFSFLNLDDHTAQMQVTAGTVIVRVRSLDQGDNYEIDTPNLAVSLLQPGAYRVEVNEDGDTTVVEVSEGDAQAAGDGQGYPIHAQQRATFTGTQQLSSVIGSLGAPDELDDWSLSRDREIQSAAAQQQQYVSPEATGYADLNDNGRWENTPDYGYVWTPTTVAVGWAPYRFGHWVWIAPWGWTWIDDARWGFTPFHYGRWVTWRGSWCWVPGPRHVRPVYAPALVGWIGAPTVGVAIGAGVGWFALGPREVYVPTYRVSPRYVQLVNVTNTVHVNRTYITNVYENRVTNITYVNRNVRGGLTTVSRSVFTSAQPVGRNLMHDVDVRGWTTRPRGPAITPTRASLVGAGLRVNVRQPPAAFQGRQVVVRTPPPRGPVAFDRQVEAIRANGGRPLGAAQLARLQETRPSEPVRVVTPQRRGAFERPGVAPNGGRPGSAEQPRPGIAPNAGRPGAAGQPRPAAPNEPSMADRARSLRGGFGTPQGERPPVAPPPAGAPPPAVRQPDRGGPPQQNGFPSRGVAPPTNELQRNEPRYERPQPREIPRPEPTEIPRPEPREIPRPQVAPRPEPQRSIPSPPPVQAPRPEPREIPRPQVAPRPEPQRSIPSPPPVQAPRPEPREIPRPQVAPRPAPRPQEQRPEPRRPPPTPGHPTNPAQDR